MPSWDKITSGAVLALTVIFLCSQPPPVLAGGDSGQHDSIATKPPVVSPSVIRDPVRLRITVKNGRIVDIVPISGPARLGAASARWVKENWKFAPDQSGTFILPVVFQRTK